MLVSYEWLSDYVDLTGITPEDIADELNRTGIEVEVIYTRDTGVRNVVVGQVIKTVPHPEADRLKVCIVNVGGAHPLQIVCGASNVATGQLVPVAIEGAQLPSGIQIQKTTLRGVESNGMICSAEELGLPDKVIMKEQTEGILVLGDDAIVGEDIRSYLSMDDQAIELQLTPNRSDCLSMIGVAYEIAAIFDRPLKLPEITPITVEGKATTVEIIIESEDDCPLYSAQVVQNVKVGPSPQWMQNRLISAGIRPINNVVDITNYVMIETGQPLHAFDYHQIQGGDILVRRARDGEKLMTLDGVERKLSTDNLLITDGHQILAMAGVMGGESSEVTNETTSVLIESAYFDPDLIRKSSRRHALRSEASNRFEKGIDPERVIPTLSRTVQLLEEITGGTVVSNVEFESIGEVSEVEVELRHERLLSLLGIQMESDEVLDIFRRLNFVTRFEDDIYYVQVPTRRQDVSIEVDLIEEVARMYGYDRIPVTLPWGQQSPGELSRQQKFRRTIKRTLRNLGLNEVVTYSLTSEQKGKEVASLHTGIQPIRLALPMSNEHAYLRTTLLPQLLETAVYNRNRGMEDVAIFEIGKSYLTEEEMITEQPLERLELSFLLTGNLRNASWNQQAVSGGDYFVAKGILEALFARLGINRSETVAVEVDGFHPGRTAQVHIQGEPVGIIGQLHPKLAKKHHLGDTMLCQIDLGRLFSCLNFQIEYEPIGRFPAVTRDVAIVLDKEVPVGELEAGIRQAAGELLESVRLFDVYTGEPLEEGKKNVAYSLVYRAQNRTLTDEEVQEAHQRVVHHLETSMGAELRQ
ncbi:phenylalanine--tRNA ligase subunit beta [Risungbinella massiliensis]|uniref:phenylalanine--tRNA ligase subunit beta n=1 Tax=Risungbinella massiliensis TaxID=1329796 RepID=UPI0005CC61C7|nr:phenylalanine--tRNA ligase subunit beta [Risungbinella massiliensis]